MPAPTGIPTFGEKQPELSYAERPCAFGVAAGPDGRILCVRVSRAGQTWTDLPGGRIETGETETGALIREFEEETGSTCQPDRLLVRTRQYLVTAKGEPRLNQSAYYAVETTGPARRDIDPDHRPVWLTPEVAIVELRDEAAALAVMLWMRRPDASAG
ncbi:MULTISPECIES: NUDIX domain-containing protein [Hyphobacterium]|uniref:NUDIX domain-containing protein n=1 Tax=Hyphobacterium vulgare TaxID=1736751 RepID=A0ABV7A0C4_9PROT